MENILKPVLFPVIDTYSFSVEYIKNGVAYKMFVYAEYKEDAISKVRKLAGDIEVLKVEREEFSKTGIETFKEE